MKTHAIWVLVLSVGACVVGPAQAAVVDTLEDIGADGTAVTQRILDGVTFTITTAAGPLEAATYFGFDTDMDAFGGAFGDADRPLFPNNVSAEKFLSVLDIDLAAPIVFTFSSPIQGFGLTTLDLLEVGVPPDDWIRLSAFDQADQLVDEDVITGPQGDSGLDLDLAVSSPTVNIVKVQLDADIDPGYSGYGIDDFTLTVPEPATVLFTAVGGLLLLLRRRHT